MTSGRGLTLLVAATLLALTSGAETVMLPTNSRTRDPTTQQQRVKTVSNVTLLAMGGSEFKDGEVCTKVDETTYYCEDGLFCCDHNLYCCYISESGPPTLSTSVFMSLAVSSLLSIVYL